MFGRMLSERLGQWHFWLSFVGAYATFLPMHLLGMAGHPRQYSQMTEVHYLQALVPLQRFITFAAIVTACGQIFFLVALVQGILHGPEAGENPWQSTTMEWLPEKGKHERVFRGAYQFGSHSNGRDFVMQTEPVIE